MLPVDEPLGEDAVVENYSHITALGLPEPSTEAMPGGGLLEGATSHGQQSAAKHSRTHGTGPSGVLEEGPYVESSSEDIESEISSKKLTSVDVQEAPTGVVPAGEHFARMSSSSADDYVTEAERGSTAHEREYGSRLVAKDPAEEAALPVTEEDEALKAEKLLKARTEGFSGSRRFGGDVAGDTGAEPQQEASQVAHQGNERQRSSSGELQEETTFAAETPGDFIRTTAEFGSGALPDGVLVKEPPVPFPDVNAADAVSKYPKSSQSVDSIVRSGQVEEASLEAELPLPGEKLVTRADGEFLPHGKSGLSGEAETVFSGEAADTDTPSDHDTASDKYSISSTAEIIEKESTPTIQAEEVQVETTETKSLPFVETVHEKAESIKVDEPARVESVTMEASDDREEVSSTRQADELFSEESSRDASGSFHAAQVELEQLPEESPHASFDVSLQHDEVSDGLDGTNVAVFHPEVNTDVERVTLSLAEEAHTSSGIEPVPAINAGPGLSAEGVPEIPHHEAVVVPEEDHMETSVQGFLPPAQINHSHHTDTVLVPQEETMGLISVPSEHQHAGVHPGGVLPTSVSSPVLVSDESHQDTALSHAMPAGVAVHTGTHQLSPFPSPPHGGHQDHVIVDASGGHALSPVGLIDHSTVGFLGADMPSNVLPPMAAAMHAMHTPLVPQEGKQLEGLAPVGVGKAFPAPQPVKIHPEVTVVTRGKKKGGKKKSAPVVPVIEKAPEPVIIEHKPVIYEPLPIVEVIEKPRKKGRRVIS